MSIKEELRKVLTIVSHLTDNGTNTTTKDTQIIAEANRPSEELEKDLHELQSLGLIKEDSSKPAGVDYRMYKITKEGINEIYNKEFR